jgi:hypothetical protein
MIKEIKTKCDEFLSLEIVKRCDPNKSVGRKMDFIGPLKKRIMDVQGLVSGQIGREVMITGSLSYYYDETNGILGREFRSGQRILKKDSNVIVRYKEIINDLLQLDPSVFPSTYEIMGGSPFAENTDNADEES